MNRYNPRKPAINPGVVDVPWVAAYLNINLNAAYALVKTPGFPCLKVGKRFIIPREGFFRWLEQAAFNKQSCGAAEKR